MSPSSFGTTSCHARLPSASFRHISTPRSPSCRGSRGWPLFVPMSTLPAGDDGRRVALRAQRRRPLDVAARLADRSRRAGPSRPETMFARMPRPIAAGRRRRPARPARLRTQQAGRKNTTGRSGPSPPSSQRTTLRVENTNVSINNDRLIRLPIENQHSSRHPSTIMQFALQSPRDLVAHPPPPRSPPGAYSGIVKAVWGRREYRVDFACRGLGWTRQPAAHGPLGHAAGGLQPAPADAGSCPGAPRLPGPGGRAGPRQSAARDNVGSPVGQVG